MGNSEPWEGLEGRRSFAQRLTRKEKVVSARKLRMGWRMTSESE